MDVLDFADGNHRTIQQDEEEAAMPSASRAAEPPPVLWNQGLRASLFPQGIIVSTVVVATNAAGCALLNLYAQAHAQSTQVLGTLLLPDQAMRGNRAVPSTPSAADKHCLIYVQQQLEQEEQQQQQQGPPVLLVSCQLDVAPERAQAVCKALLAEVCPDHVVVLGSISQESYAGPGDASQEPLLFSLSTTISASAPAGSLPAQQKRLPPVLPPGNACGGLPAALLSYCQVRGMDALLLVSVDMVPALAPLSLPPLAAALQAVSGSAGWPDALRQAPGTSSSAGAGGAVAATHL